MAERYQSHVTPDGVVMVDTVTGEIVLTPLDGSPPRVLQRGNLASPSEMPVTPQRGLPTRPGPFTLGALDEEIVSTYPLPVATAWSAFLNESEPRLQCRLLVDAFSQLLRYWALVSASDYLANPRVRDHAVNEMLVRDLQRPLVSAWNLLVRRVLETFAVAEEKPFIPELGEAYERLETNCRNMVPVPIPVEDADGNRTTRIARLTTIQALLKFRNSHAHGLLSSERARVELDRFLPPMRSMLSESAFLARYPLCLTDTQSPQGTRKLMGLTASIAPHFPSVPSHAKRSPLFLVSERTHLSLPLFVFMDWLQSDTGADQVGGDILLYDGKTRTAILYLSPQGEHLQRQKRAEEWTLLLATKNIEARLLSLETLTVEAIRIAARRSVDASLGALTSSGKYLRDATVTRTDLATHLQGFETSALSGFLLGGESGIGKSTLMARQVESWIAAGDIVWFFRASSITEKDIGLRIMRELGLPDVPFAELLETLSPLMERTASTRMRIVVDALNENPDFTGLLRNFDGLVAQVSLHPWARAYGSIRTPSWERLSPADRPGLGLRSHYYQVEEGQGVQVHRTSLIQLRSLGDTETEQMYAAYRAFRLRDPADPADSGEAPFRPLTSFHELSESGSTRALLRSPLLMRLILATYSRRHLPSEIAHGTVLKLYLEQVVFAPQHAAGPPGEREAFLKAIVREMDLAAQDSIARDLLYTSAELMRAIQRADGSSAYSPLLDLGVLLEDWHGDRCSVRFAYDPLLEHLLADLHAPGVETAANLIHLSQRSESFRALRGCLEELVFRASHDGRSQIVADALEQTTWSTALLAATRAAIVHLARARSPALINLLEQLGNRSASQLARTLCGAFDDLALVGDIEAADLILANARAAAQSTVDSMVAAEVEIRHASRLEQQGRWDDASCAYREVRLLAVHAMAATLVHRVDVLLGSMARDRGDTVEGLSRLRSAAAGLESLGLLGTASIAWSDIALAQYNIGISSVDAATKALFLAERSEDSFTIAHALNSMGNALSEAGQPKEAERSHLRALAIRQRIGDLSGQAATLHNLGMICTDAAIEDAIEYLDRSMAIERRLNRPFQIAIGLWQRGRTMLRAGLQEEGRMAFFDAGVHFVTLGSDWALQVWKEFTDSAPSTALRAPAITKLGEVLQTLPESSYRSRSLANRSLARLTYDLHSKSAGFIESSVEVAEASGDQFLMAAASLDAGTFLLGNGSASPAIPHLMRAVDRNTALGQTAEAFESASTLAMAAIQDSLANASSLLADAIDRVDLVQSSTALVTGCLRLAKALTASSNAPEAEGLLTRAIDRARSLGDGGAESQLFRELGLLNADSPSRAFDLFTRARDVAESVAHPQALAAAENSIATWMVAQGLLPDALHHFRVAALTLVGAGKFDLASQQVLSAALFLEERGFTRWSRHLLEEMKGTRVMEVELTRRSVFLGLAVSLGFLEVPDNRRAQEYASLVTPRHDDLGIHAELLRINLLIDEDNVHEAGSALNAVEQSIGALPIPRLRAMASAAKMRLTIRVSPDSAPEAMATSMACYAEWGNASPRAEDSLGMALFELAKLELQSNDAASSRRHLRGAQALLCSSRRHHMAASVEQFLAEATQQNAAP